jgi:hypothetical protein
MPCPDKLGCPPGVCPDFVIRRHDTRPPFKVQIEDCDGPIDLTGLVLEVSMWALAKTKKALTTEETSFALADGIGFDQILPGDVIIADRVRSPEKMLVVGFDEPAGLVEVQRGYEGTTPSAWKKGARLRIFRVTNQPGVTEMVMEPPTGLEDDPATTEEVLSESYLCYEWGANDTCVPGCFWLEFKLIKMSEGIAQSSSSTDVCSIGMGVEWVRRFPVEGEGFLIKVQDSPTQEYFV